LEVCVCGDTPAYRNEFARLCESAEADLEGSPLLDALRQWMSSFLDYASAKLGMADALRTVIDSAALHIPTRAA
jgi:hypothetical protein